MLTTSLPLALMKMKGCRKKFVLTDFFDKSATSNCVGNMYMEEYRSDVGIHLYHLREC